MKHPRFNPFPQEVSYITIIDCRESVNNIVGTNGVLRKLKHIFPNTYQRIKSIRSPAKGRTGCYRFNYQPGSWLEGVGDTPPSTVAQLSFFARPRAKVSGVGGGPSYLFFGKY